MTYTEFKRMHIDLGALGAEGGRNAVRYTCTPKGAKIFGWAGVDGIHFCTVKGYGETIFSVSPMNPGQDCVQPLARDMGDFLRLLLACGDTAALEQAWMWDEAQFEAFLRENPPTEAQRAVMREIEEKCGLTPMEEPWRYLKKVRAETDCSGLRFEKEYEELLHPVCREPQEWEVYFEYGSGGKKPRHRPGREITLGKTFTWGKEEWLVPAMYCCSEGVVLDLLKKVPLEALERFAEKWGLEENGEPRWELPPAEQDAMEAENPMEERFRAEVTVNGQPLRESTGYGSYWKPEDGCCDEDADRVLEHYELERDCGWAIWRVCCLWNGGIDHDGRERGSGRGHIYGGAGQNSAADRPPHRADPYAAGALFDAGNDGPQPAAPGGDGIPDGICRDAVHAGAAAAGGGLCAGRCGARR